jgi:23S rRNA (guanosine2251-2'-O)-methyltransferase
MKPPRRRHEDSRPAPNDGRRRDAPRRDGQRPEARRRDEPAPDERHRADQRRDERSGESFRGDPTPRATIAEGAHLYGLLPVVEALRAGSRRVERVTIAEGAHEGRLHDLFELARAAGVPVRRAPRAELQRMAAPGANHQGVIANVAAVAYRDADELLDQLSARVGTISPPLAVVLDGVEDPRNLGAIVRTAECAGVHALFIPERRAAGLTETAAKTAAGALEYLPVARAANVARLVEDLKGRGIWTVGTDADANIDYTEWDWTQPCALLFGGEGSGLRRLVRERCDALVRIPLRGRISSLNVSVAAGIVLYEAVRQRTTASESAYTRRRATGEGV